MEIQLKYNNQPMNKISKSLSQVVTLNGTLREESSIVDPVILVEYADPLTANYAYIPAFRRYYYIKEATVFRDNLVEGVHHTLWRLELHTDVLMTFSEGILGSPCIISKSTNYYDMYLNDDEFKCRQNNLFGYQRFPKGFNDEHGSYVVAVMCRLVGEESNE